MTRCVTSGGEAYLLKYPVAANELLHFPMMFPETVRRFHVPGVPFARLEFLYAVGGYYGLSQGTIRTALSRMKTSGYVEALKDGAATRYRVSLLQRGIMENYEKEAGRALKGYVVAIYSFEKAEEKKRSSARSLLEYEGFVRFAQNSYIRTRIDISELRAKLVESALDSNVFFFEVDKIEREDISRMAAAWKISERAAYLEEFLKDTMVFIESGDGSAADAFLRQAGAWVSFIAHVQGTEPPLPAELLPKGYAYSAIRKYLERQSTRDAQRMLHYYMANNR
jgi:DNA-binding transcriptional regulator PaaX